MGSSDGEQDRFSAEGPQHPVTITQSFYIGKYEVTQAQWEAVMGDRPSYFSGQPDNPVEQVSWYDCQNFLDLLNLLDLGTFRLPTEAEWEYAGRAGTATRFYWGDDPDYSQINDYAWYWGNSKRQTHNVGSKLPNAWGLFDMGGNVWEWRQDWYEDYTADAQIDPQGPDYGIYKVLRSGSWDRESPNIRSARRSDWCPENWSDPSFKGYFNGFRLVRNL